MGFRDVSTKCQWNCVLFALCGSSGLKLTHLMFAQDPLPPSTSWSVQRPPTYFSVKSWAASGSAQAIVFFRGRSAGRAETAAQSSAAATGRRLMLA